MLRNYRVAAQLVASRVVLSSTELVSYCHHHLTITMAIITTATIITIVTIIAIFMTTITFAF
jgi:hypothetical protein